VRGAGENADKEGKDKKEGEEHPEIVKLANVIVSSFRKGALREQVS
jgi:hypothetical protein